jgi:seryl-tRNA synthetase
MLDIKFIINNLEVVRASIQRRHVKDNLDELLEVFEARKTYMQALEEKRAASNLIAKNIVHADHLEKPKLIETGRRYNQEIAAMELESKSLDERYQCLLMTVPNILADDTPEGFNDKENQFYSDYSFPKEFSFVPKDHLELGKKLDIIDFDSGVKVSGARFYFLKRYGVLLEQALKLFVMKMAMQFDYIPLLTPDLAKKSVLLGAGYNPRGDESNVYNIEDLDLSLIATAEIPVAGMHANEMLDLQSLPIKYVAESHCFRREAGSYGKESKGLYRVHQFSKIELFQITTPENSDRALMEILQLEEAIYQKLEIPYRVMRICAGDLGAPAFKKYDIEAFMPGREADSKYGEITSASNCTDFQARRLNIRYRDANNAKHYVHTLNGTAIALSRTIIAILENYQEADGSVLVPKVLQEYMGVDVLKIN